ncbi:hypothetical protein GCM10027290_13970 [Micromonospora sonneratiae]
MPVHRRLLDTAPGYIATRADIEDFTFQECRRRRAEPPRVVRVPVVVHVVWHDEAQNISDDQVHSQITVLNADFRKRNADLTKVPQVWQSVVGDARVEFALATTDPNGAPTSGITRTRTGTTAFDTDDAVKSAATGGVDAWPAGTYLNIWACQLGGGVLGYAQFPGGPAATDGVVVLHSSFGTTGTAAAPFNGGRTTTHEVGHWLNLRHIWGDDGEGCGGDDFVADTPNQGGPNYGKPTWPTMSCQNGPDGDMFMNFMDYTDDDAMCCFTVGQAARMAACLAGPRASLAAGDADPPVDQRPTGDAAPPAALFRRWVHVREEDTPGVRVYRRADLPLPPARGRDGIEFHPDGTFVDLRPGPVDAPVGATGRWSADGDGCRLELTYPNGRAAACLHIVTVDENVLCLRPLAG